MTRRGVRVLLLLGLIASCAAPKPSPAPAGHDAAFDCAAIQGPLSRDRFYEDNPTYTDPVDDSASWTLSTPQARGMDPGRLERASAALADLPYSWSFLVIRHDALVFERYYHGSARNQSNNVHSASKSIWGAAIGIAVDEGLIPGVDATVASTLPPRYGAVMGPETKTVRVRDLLTMTSGSQWDEDATETEIERTPDWVAATLRLPRAAAPGTRFNYSTGDSHLGSAVLTAATETTACEFVHEHLLAPLGVVAEHWGRDPQGYFSGGYNFYVTPRELAKFGLLYLHGGRWHGKQLVPADWVETSMTEQVDAGAPYGYGYDFWLRDLAGHQVAMAWGYGGQMVYIVRDLDLVVVMTTNTRDFAPDSFDGSTIVENDVLAAAR
ncbi:serine hydrolase [Actinophytocola sp.]|uniref:serine hydrolase domain-containing protein n=1 Tax=Actinophytocola sp. TaxID=1872138 RepID=UPI002D55CB8C|nr:serine hydrolase [Actinophytocola sp.]HYQ67634.1 serine hydrolase [Actinophytocola sp.]